MPPRRDTRGKDSAATIGWLFEWGREEESSDESVKVICWLPQKGESSGVSVKVIRWLSGREGLRESSGESSGESVKVIGWLASP